MQQKHRQQQNWAGPFEILRAAAMMLAQMSVMVSTETSGDTGRMNFTNRGRQRFNATPRSPARAQF